MWLHGLKKIPFIGDNCVDKKCPDNCTGPSNGICDASTGICSCINEHIGDNCEGKKTKVNKIWYIYENHMVNLL